jgi:penicillin-binding protein 2
VGVDRLAWYAKAAGLGKATGINLPHEANGLIPTAAWKKKRTGIAWQPGETLSLAIGQGFNLVTPLQMAVLTAAIGNGGTLYRPEILRKAETAEGQLVAMSEPVSTGRLPVSESTMELVKQGLWEVVNTDKGTAKGARFPGLEVSGKTGTAQVISRKDGEEEDLELPDHKKPHAWFVAYAPATDPEIAVAVLVENGEHGSSAAAPIAREMIKAYLLKKQLQPLLVANGRAVLE